MSFALRPHQIPAFDAVLKAKDDGIRRPLLCLPTGAGKTAILAALAVHLNHQVLILVHREELLEQTIRTLQAAMPAAAIGRIQRGIHEDDRQVIVASVQTLSRPARFARLPKTIQSVFVDEAHHATARTYRTILTHLKAGTKQGPWLLGVTATPERTDQISLGTLFDQIVYQRSLYDYLESGLLCPLRALQIRLSANLDRVSTRGGDFQDRLLSEHMIAANAPAQIVATYRTHAAARRRTLIFTPTVAMAEAVTDAFTRAGYKAALVHGAMPSQTRRALLREFHHGRIAILVNCLVFTEGFDEPLIDCVIMARPTLSQGLYLQMLGRGTRLADGKKDCLILDCVGVTTRHDIVTTSQLFGLPLSDRTPRLLSRPKTNQTTKDALATSSPEPSIDLTAFPVVLTRGGKRWHEVSPDLYQLSLGAHGHLTVSRFRQTTWSLSMHEAQGNVIRLRIERTPTALLESGLAFALYSHADH